MLPKRAAHVDQLGEDMLHYATTTDSLDTVEQVLNKLHDVTQRSSTLNVLGAALFPLRWGDLSSLEVDKTIFFHKSAPHGWWDEYVELSKHSPSPALHLMSTALAPQTDTELMQVLEPLGVDRWPNELALKYGMRDGLTCPVGGRWVVAYWSRQTLRPKLCEETRAILFMGATFAAIRLQKLVRLSGNRLGSPTGLTPRELSVLRLFSNGHQVHDAAQLLGLGEETVRTHAKKAMEKLGANNRTQAVAQAIRLHLIP